VKIAVNARHMDATDAIHEYVQTKADKLDRYYDKLHKGEVVLEIEADQAHVEFVVTADGKHTFVSEAKAPDLYAAVDKAVEKMIEQVRRHKDKVRDRKGPPHSQTMNLGQ
jgi:putative sigma-54 modulation protein